MKRFKNILCVVEQGEACKPALERAVTLSENNQANLTVVDVVPRINVGIGIPNTGLVSDEVQKSMVSAHTQDLETLVAPYRKKIEIHTKVLKGTSFLEIIREVIRNGHDLVIKVPEICDWLDRLFGSDDMHLLRKCPCPVWLIKPGTQTSYRRILATVDTNDMYPPAKLTSQRAINQQILEMAASLALSDSAELHIMSVWETIGESAMHSAFLNIPEENISTYLEQARQRCAEDLEAIIRKVINKLGEETLDYLKPRTHVVKGSARKEIPALAKRIEADLIVMGTVARTGIPGFIIGNTAETILNQIDCSVLAIKPPGFVTPVTLEG